MRVVHRVKIRATVIVQDSIASSCCCVACLSRGELHWLTIVRCSSLFSLSMACFSSSSAGKTLFPHSLPEQGGPPHLMTRCRSFAPRVPATGQADLAFQDVSSVPTPDAVCWFVCLFGVRRVAHNPCVLISFSPSWPCFFRSCPLLIGVPQAARLSAHCALWP
jgi:hypothetical protein